MANRSAEAHGRPGVVESQVRLELSGEQLLSTSGVDIRYSGIHHIVGGAGSARSCSDFLGLGRR